MLLRNYPLMQAAAPAADQVVKAMSLQASAAVEIHAAAEGEAAKRPTVNLTAYSGGIMRLAFYCNPVVIDLAGLTASDPVNLFSDGENAFHCTSMANLVGQAEEVKIGSGKVTVRGIITGNLEDPASPASLIVGHARNGLKKFPVSVGVMPTRVEDVQPGVKVRINGRSFTGPLTVCREGLLREVSFVGVGADAGASGSVAASATQTERNQAMTFEQWCTSKGWDAAAVAAMSDNQKTSLTAAWKADLQASGQGAVPPSNTPPAPPAPPVEGAGHGAAPTPAQQAVTEMRAAAAAEQARIAEIQKLCGSGHQDIAAKAIAEGWDVQKTELAVLKASRPSPSMLTGSGSLPAGVSQPQVMEAALCMAAALPNLEKRFQAPVLEAAGGQFRGGLHLQELLLLAASQAGYSGRMAITRGNVMEVIQAAFSTASLTTLLSNVTGKFLLEGFNSIEQAWREVAGIRSVSDFKTSTAVRLLASGNFAKVGADGAIKHGTLSNESYTNKADTYGRLFGITRTDAINDDLGALTQVPMDLGILGGKTLNVEFWTEFLADAATFYTADLGNYASGAGTALGFTSLAAAIAAFLTMKGPDGHPLGVSQNLKLLVPPALQTTADTLFKSTEVRDTTASTKTPTANTLAGRAQPVVSSYLSDSAITGYSVTAWYLTVGQPAPTQVIEVVFLDGQQTPTVEAVEAEAEYLGQAFRAYYDFGVNKQDYRAAQKRAGA